MLALCLLFQVGTAAPPPPIEIGARIEPDTVTIGQPFRVTVRVRAPQGARIEFPPGPDSAGPVEALDTRTVTDGADSTATEATAIYRLAAWDVGAQPIGIPDITVRIGTETHPVSLGDRSVFVRKLTPPDSARRVPRPARPILAAPRPWWWWAGPAAVVLAVLLLIWWLARLRRRRAPPPPVNALSVAERELGRVDKMGLIEAGERGRYIALTAEVVRDYLARRIPDANVSLTTGEVLAVLRDDARVPIERLRSVLTESDAVKFSGHGVSRDRALEVGRDARAVIAAIDGATDRTRAA
jgi:hypothetical protein